LINSPSQDQFAPRFLPVFIGRITTSLTRYRSTLGKSSIVRPSLATCHKNRRKLARQELLTSIKSNVPSPKTNLN